MHSRNLCTYSDDETPEQTYQKAFEQRRQIINAIKGLEAQKPFLKGMSLEQLKKWEISYEHHSNELTVIDQSISDWLTHYPHLARHSSLNSILQMEQVSRTQTSHLHLTYANSSATLFSMGLADFHPGVSTPPVATSPHRLSVKLRR